MKLAPLGAVTAGLIVLGAAARQAAAPKQCRYLSGKTGLLPFPNDASPKAAGDADQAARGDLAPLHAGEQEGRAASTPPTRTGSTASARARS